MESVKKRTKQSRVILCDIEQPLSWTCILTKVKKTQMLRNLPLSKFTSLLMYFVIFHLQQKYKLYSILKRCFIIERSYLPTAYSLRGNDIFHCVNLFPLLTAFTHLSTLRAKLGTFYLRKSEL